MLRTWSLSLVSLLAIGIGCETAPPPVDSDCAKLARFEAREDYQACERGTLSNRSPGGIWHLDHTLDDESQNASRQAPIALSLTVAGGGFLLGRPLNERVEDESTAFFAVGYTSGTDTVRFAYAGCALDTTDRFHGFYEVCLNGQKVRGGTFDAVHLQRRPGEAESENLSLVAELPLAGIPSALAVSGGHAYVPYFQGGLSVVDVTTPASPGVAAVVEAPDAGGGWLSAATASNALYIASNVEGTLVYDVTDPSAPVRVRNTPSTGYDAEAVVVTGNALDVVGPSAGQVLRYDLTNPLTPLRTLGYSPPAVNPTKGRSPQGAFEFENRLYVASRSLGVVIVDLTNVASPVTLGGYVDAQSSSRSVVVARYGLRLIAFEAGDDWGAHVRVLDVTDAPNATLIAEWPMRDEVTVRALALSGTHLYVAHLQDGLRVLDVSVPESPQPLAYFNTWREDDPNRGLSFIDGAMGVSVPGDGFVYVAESGRGLLVFPEIP